MHGRTWKLGLGIPATGPQFVCQKKLLVRGDHSEHLVDILSKKKSTSSAWRSFRTKRRIDWLWKIERFEMMAPSTLIV
jgi:hypothetical protein